MSEKDTGEAASAPMIAAIGLCTPLGETLEATLDAYKDGKQGISRASGWVGSDGNAPRLAGAQPPEAEREYSMRLLFMFERAMVDCYAQAPWLTRTDMRFELHLCLPAWMQNDPGYKRFARWLSERPIAHVSSITPSYGEGAAAITALDKVAARIEAGEIQAAFVAGLDSYIEPLLLDRVDALGFMLKDGNPYGFVPGEACGVALVAASHLIPTPAARILGFGTGKETGLAGVPMVDGIVNAEPAGGTQTGIKGQGLAKAMKDVSNSFTDIGKPARIMSDLNGQRWRAEQYAFAVARTGQLLGSAPHDPECPSLALGDLGAATGVTLLALTLGEGPKRETEPDAPSSKYPALVVGSNLDGNSAAIAITSV
ncbi:hypothetical protein HGP17_24885 [Rhizobium sp. P38BS-XIX]|uniref:hypothetical protein n=1 Tax=Rhizobium sp. P38BS-XIX TaxID=2726740 RepID=UPI001456C546|nr:hypothetical protein [Rhizobium sp. P38BS-XIX]NLS00074.1 hypothetical protein [Rhizobium sp. P38BS-XIX]